MLCDLQEELRPILLRRMKEDVENLPEKEEVVVWVQLTHQQRSYYKALYSNQVSTCRTLKSLQNTDIQLLDITQQAAFHTIVLMCA